jgi:predicted N-acetyltransferase YhbS
MLTIRQEKSSDVAAREALLDAAYGPTRFEKPSNRLRIGRPPARGLSFVALEYGIIIGTVQLWRVSASNQRATLLLGPLAVDPTCRKRGIGAALTHLALDEARLRGHQTVLLVGDVAYYARFGFAVDKTGGLWLPGLADKGRLLGCELTPGALDGMRGTIRAPLKPSRAPLVAALRPKAA